MAETRTVIPITGTVSYTLGKDTWNFHGVPDVVMVRDNTDRTWRVVGVNTAGGVITVAYDNGAPAKPVVNEDGEYGP